MSRTIMTAISLNRDLFERGEQLAGEMQISRSRLFALALEDFIRGHQNEQLLARINEAYADGLDRPEEALLKKMRRHHRKLVKNQW